VGDVSTLENQMTVIKAKNILQLLMIAILTPVLPTVLQIIMDG
jgi:hypothetical protein